MKSVLKERQLLTKAQELEIKRITLELDTRGERVVQWLNVHDVFDPMSAPHDNGFPYHYRIMVDWLNLFVRMGNKHGVRAYALGVLHSQCQPIYISRYAWSREIKRWPVFREYELKPDHPALKQKILR